MSRNIISRATKTLLCSSSAHYGMQAGRVFGQAGGADPLGLLQAVAQNLILDKPPGILHRLDQRALVVTRRRAGFLVFNLRIFRLAV